MTQSLNIPGKPLVGELFRILVRTDLKARYHGTVGGFMWALLKPLAMFVVLLSVFSFVFVADPQYKLNLIIGLFLFDFFSEATKVGVTSLFFKGYLLTKVRFPSWVVVVSSAANPLLALFVFVGIITVFVSITRTAPGPVEFVLFIAYLGAFFVMIVGINLATSVLFLRYRDLNQVWDVVIQAGMFVAPVIYPMQIIPERYRAWLYLWPPTPVIQYSRAVLVDGRIPSTADHAWLIAQSATLLVAGMLVFARYSPRAAEHL